MKELQPSLKTILRPYFFISIAGLLAFAPVSFMLRALKNDVIALEYPINHFMSQCLHNGELPYWFNTWGMGFPLQSNLTWGIFSTPQMLFCSLFNYNIYILHIEFMFFVLLAGWSMFHLLSKYLIKDKTIAQLLAISYMLSGFMVGSTQWLLYITAAAFIPLVISSLLKLLYTPCLKNAVQFGVMYSLMFTSVYAAFNIITTYSLAIFILIWILQSNKNRKANGILLPYLLAAGIFTILLCFPCLYYTIELLKYIERGDAITSDNYFFNSNYLHPAALSSLLFPFSSVKMHFSNTEGTMLNSYAGLFVLLLMPAGIWFAIKEKNRSALILLFSSLLFLLISFGEMIPVRKALNFFPGFSYFRNPSIFRFYFLLCLILFLSSIFKNKSFVEIFDKKKNAYSKGIHYTGWVIAAICVIAFAVNFSVIRSLPVTSLNNFIKNINLSQTILINSFLQAFILIAVLLCVRMKKLGFIKIMLTLDLIFNTLICTPFFSVSNYSIPVVSRILNAVPGFPVQETKPSVVAATYTDERNNVWNNVNIFNKQVSTNETYRGPLTLNHFYVLYTDSLQKKTNNNFAFANNNQASLQVIIQRPGHVRIDIDSDTSALICIMQNYYSGWQAWYNNKEIKIVSNENPGMSVFVPKGKGTIDFRYERKGVWLPALLLHLITISFFLTRIFYFFKKRRIKSSSLS